MTRWKPRLPTSKRWPWSCSRRRKRAPPRGSDRPEVRVTSRTACMHGDRWHAAGGTSVRYEGSYMRHGLLLPLIAAAIALSSTFARAGEPAPRETQQKLDTYIAEQMEAGGIAGLGAALLVDGKVVW